MAERGYQLKKHCIDNRVAFPMQRQKISTEGIKGEVGFVSAQLFLIFILYKLWGYSFISLAQFCWAHKGKPWLCLKTNCKQAVTKHSSSITASRKHFFKVCSTIHCSIMFQTYSNTPYSCLPNSCEDYNKRKTWNATQQGITNRPKTFLNICVHPGRSFLTNCMLTEGGARLVSSHVFCLEAIILFKMSPVHANLTQTSNQQNLKFNHFQLVRAELQDGDNRINISSQDRQEFTSLMFEIKLIFTHCRETGIQNHRQTLSASLWKPMTDGTKLEMWKLWEVSDLECGVCTWKQKRKALNRSWLT